MGSGEDLLAGGGGERSGEGEVGRALHTVGVEYRRSGSECIRPSAARSRDPREHRQPGWAKRQAAQPWRGGYRGGRPWWGCSVGEGEMLGLEVVMFLVVRLCGKLGGEYSAWTVTRGHNTID